MSGPAFLRGPASTSSYATSGGQSRLDEPEAATPAQRDGDQAHAEHAKAEGFVREAKQLATVRPYEWEAKRAGLARRLEAFAETRTTSANATPGGDRLRQQTAAAIVEARQLLADAKPPRAVAAVTGEADLAPKIADKSAAPGDVIAWMTRLPLHDRRAVWHRYGAITGGRHKDSPDLFAIDLANYLAEHREVTDELHRLATMSAKQVAREREEAREAEQAAAAAEPTATEPQGIQGLSRPMDPLGQSRIPVFGGQSLADPARDVDHDGRADVPRHTLAEANKAKLTEAAQRAVQLLPRIAASLSPFAAARDQLEAATVRVLGEDISSHLAAAADLHAMMSDGAAGHGDHADPLAVSLGARLKAALAQATTEIGPHRFAGRPVMPGASAVAPGNHQLAAVRLSSEADHVADLIDRVVAIRDAWIATNGAPSPEQQRQISDQLAPLPARPVHFYFVKTALTHLGIWAYLENYQAPKSQRDPSSFGGIFANAAAQERTVADLDKDAALQTRQFGPMVDLHGFDQATAIELLQADSWITYVDDAHEEVTRKSRNARKVLGMMADLDAAARSSVLEHFRKANVLDLFCGGLPWRSVEQLDKELAAGYGDVRRELGRYYMHRNTEDNSVSAYLKRVPGVGGALESVGNFATFGFLRSHDAAYRAERQGQITGEEFAGATGDAAAIAGAMIVLSTVGATAGGAALKGASGAAIKGLAGEAALETVGGRIATGAATGLGGGALGAVGGRAGHDLATGDLSSVDEYTSDALTGAKFGLALGGGGAAAGEAGAALADHIPPSIRARLVQLAEKFPTLEPDGPILKALADLSERAGAAPVKAGIAAGRAASRAGAAAGRAAGDAVVRVAATAADFAKALQAGALEAPAAIEAAINRAASKTLAVSDKVASAGFKAVGVDPAAIANTLDDGMRPAAAAGSGAAPSGELVAELRATSGDHAAITKMEGLGDGAAAPGSRPSGDLAKALGDAPEAAEGMHIIDGEADAARMKHANAAAEHSNVGARTPLAEHIPPPGPEFVAWFDGLTKAELAKFLADRGPNGARAVIENNIRHPFHLHEWVMVKHAMKAKEWGVSLQTVLDARTETALTIGKNFRHTAKSGKGSGPGSGQMHRDLDKMILESKNFNEFRHRLNIWADRELYAVGGAGGQAPRGRYYLPENLQMPAEGAAWDAP